MRFGAPFVKTEGILSNFAVYPEGTDGRYLTTMLETSSLQSLKLGASESTP